MCGRIRVSGEKKAKGDHKGKDYHWKGKENTSLCVEKGGFRPKCGEEVKKRTSRLQGKKGRQETTKETLTRPTGRQGRGRNNTNNGGQKGSQETGTYKGDRKKKGRSAAWSSAESGLMKSHKRESKKSWRGRP